MKGKFVLVLLAVLMLGTLGVAYADPDDNAASHVYVNVDPNIAVAPQLISVALGSVQTGPFSGGITFRVDANTQKVKFMAGVSPLYKGDDPTDPTVPPIVVAREPGVGMVADDGNPTGGHAPSAVYLTGGGQVIGGFPSLVTEWVTFESSQNNHFSQNFVLTPTWVQTDPEKPMGEYSGVVALWAMIVLP